MLACEKMLMSVSYYTSKNNRLQINEAASNQIIKELCDKNKKCPKLLPLIQKHVGHDEDKDTLKLKGNKLFPMWSLLQNSACLCLELTL